MSGPTLLPCYWRSWPLSSFLPSPHFRRSVSWVSLIPSYWRQRWLTPAHLPPVHEKKRQRPPLVLNVCRPRPHHRKGSSKWWWCHTKIPLHTFLPSVEDCNHIWEEFEVLIARVICEQMEYLKSVPQHMKHKYSDSMRLKSETVSSVCHCCQLHTTTWSCVKVAAKWRSTAITLLLQVPLGVLTKSEQAGDDMIDIMTHIHKYIPQNKDGKFIPVFFGGDQLTRERAGGALDAQLQASDPPVVVLKVSYQRWKTGML